MDRRRHLRRSAEAAHRHLAVGKGRRAGREHRGRDFARGNGIGAHAERRELGRHLPRQRQQRRLAAGVGDAGVRMHARARDRGDVDDRPLGGGEVLDQPLRQQRRGEQVDVEHLQPRRVARPRDAEPAAIRRLRRDAGIVDQRVEPPVRQPAADLVEAGAEMLGVAEVELDVVLRAAEPRAARRERLPRQREHAPAVVGEQLSGGVADAAAGAGQQQDALGHAVVLPGVTRGNRWLRRSIPCLGAAVASGLALDQFGELPAQFVHRERLGNTPRQKGLRHRVVTAGCPVCRPVARATRPPVAGIAASQLFTGL